MNELSPLDKPELREIDDCLSAGELDRAQTLLAQLQHDRDQGVPASYLATRLLYLRGRLDARSVADRLEDLLVQSPDFPEASALLALAQATTPASQPTLSQMPSPPRGVAPGNSTLTSVPPFAPALASAPPPFEWGSEQPPANRDSIFPAAPGPDSLGAFPSFTDFEHLRPSSAAPAAPSQPGEASERRISVDTRTLGTQLRPSAPPPGRWAQERESYRPEGRYSRASIGGAPEAEGDAATSAAHAARRQSDRPSQPPSIPPRRPSNRAAARPALTSSRPPPAPGTTARASRPAPPAPRVPSMLEPVASFWSPVELRLWRSERKAALDALESLASQATAALGAHPNLTRVAQAGAELLTRAPVLRLFGPYDQSLISLARLNLGLTALLGIQPERSHSPHLVLLTGAYLGETLRHSHRARWHGEPSRLLSLSVRLGPATWEPFQIAKRRFSRPDAPSLQASVQEGLAKAGTPPWFESVPAPANAPWWITLPSPLELGALSQELCRSPMAILCRDLYGHGLDESLDSLDPLGELFGTLVTSATPLTGEEPWLKQLCVLLGAYVGATVKTRVRAEWILKPVETLEDYALSLPNGKVTRPMSALLRHATRQQPAELFRYASRLLDHA